MLFIDFDCVHSHRDGYGLIVRGGRNPVVRWLDGRESRVCGNALKLVSDRKYAAVVRNRLAVEDWTYRRVCDVPYPFPLARTSFQKPDLLTRLRKAAREPDIPPAGPVQRDRVWFVEDELVMFAHWALDENLQRRSPHVRVEMRRMDDSDW